MKNLFDSFKHRKKILRWIILMIIGMILTCYGFSQILVLDRLELTDIVKILITCVLGIGLFIIGIVFIQRRTLELAILKDTRTMEKLGDSKDRGPKIVVIGGGIGLSKVLTGLKNYTNNLTAIVTVTTYGNETKHKPTDNIRNSIISLAKDSNEMSRLMNASIDGEIFGNKYLQAITSINQDFAEGIKKSNSVLAMVGKVLPATLDEMKICVELDDGTVIEEKEKIAEVTNSKVTKINRVYINPTNCRTTPGIIESIKEADAIVIGPGSLYAEVIPNLLIRNVAKTIRESKAYKIYISNIMTESGHTDDYALSNHIHAIIEHAGSNIMNYCICDNGDIIPEILRKYNKAGSNLVEIDKQNIKGINIINADVSETEGEYIRHNPDETAKQIIEIILNDLKFKDKKTNEHYILLSAKLKDMKKKMRRRKKPKQVKKTRVRTKSKFSSKYQDRITSIKESEQTTNRNKLNYEKSKETSGEGKKVKKKLPEETSGKHSK